jgi:excinuclease ABC subunit B
MYADTITESMRRAINETNRRREMQLRFNEEHSITPQSIKKTIDDIMQGTAVADAYLESVIRETRASYATIEEVPYLIADLEREMKQAVKKLEFEQAAALRDRIAELRQQMASLALPPRRKIRGKERIHRG